MPITTGQAGEKVIAAVAAMQAGEPSGGAVTTESKPESEPGRVETIDQVVIRFAGDSGDGMQVTGDRFTDESALFGNDLSTLPELPGRDPGAGGHPGGCLRLPDPHLRPRDPHARATRRTCSWR